MHKPQAGFDPPPQDGTSYEADALSTKPPRLDQNRLYITIIFITEVCKKLPNSTIKGNNKKAKN